MRCEDIKTVLIIGAGTMGHQIGFQCAVSGYDVMLYDVFPEMLKKAEERLDSLARRLVKKKMISSALAEEARERMVLTSDARKAGENADIVSESVPEDPKLKGELFAKFNDICPPATIFTTNTSSLVPSMFAMATGRPEQLLALHFHDIALSRIVDVMPHAGTDATIVEIVVDFAEKIGQIPIVLKKEQPGYLFNNMLMAYLDAALSLASAEVASIEDIDRAWMGIMHTPAGPFGIMDSVGLDTCWKITHYWAEKKGNTKALKNAAFIKSHVDAGYLGQKSGRGFYTYPAPTFESPDFLTKGTHTQVI